MCAVAAAVLFSLGARPARADVPPGEAPPGRDRESESPRSAPTRTYGSFAFGGSSGSEGAILCAELAPLPFLSVAGCGNGSGFLHHDAAPDLSHWRLNLTVTSLDLGAFSLQPRLQLGFAEMQVGEDTPGFDFASTNEAGTSTSGAEGGASVRAVWPLQDSGFEALAEVGLSAAYLPHAPALVRPQAVFTPSASLTLGLGF